MPAADGSGREDDPDSPGDRNDHDDHDDRDDHGKPGVPDEPDSSLDPDAYDTVEIDPRVDVPYDAHPVLVPVAIFERESIPRALIDLLTPVPVVVLGYHVLPDQTPPGQARLQFEERAQNELDDLVQVFEAAGGTVETRLAFTHDAAQTIERVAIDDRCSAILLVNPAPTVDRVLVALRDDRNVEQVVGVAAMLANTDIEVTVYHVAANETGRERGAELVAAAADLLEAEGVSRDSIVAETVVSEAPIRTLVSRADDDYDLVIIGETKPTLRERIVGETPRRIADRSLEPVLVVRRVEQNDDDPTGDGERTNDE